MSGKQTRIKEVFRILGRGLKSSCPQCGKKTLFRSWNSLNEFCSECGLSLVAREPDTWFVMYVSTAAITGVFIIFMLLFVPRNQSSARWWIGLLALVVYVVTTGARKGFAIALDYLVDLRSEFPRHPGVKK